MDSAPTAAPSASELADAVRSALREVYDHPIVCELEDGRVAVLGGKAIELAHAAALTQFGAEGADRVVELDVSTLPWSAVPTAGLQLWRQYGRSGADGELVTDLEAGDPDVQVVTEIEGWQLVRTLDGAQGWLPASQGLLTDLAVHEVEYVDAGPGDHGPHFDPEAMVAEALAFLDVPYVWGGTTDAGVDCSGIVQRVVWRTSQVWLPRHSRALLTVGERVSPSSVAAGDILVLKRDPRTIDAERAAQLAAQQAEQERTGSVGPTGPAVHPMHVAIAVSDTDVVHASRDAMRVVREPLASLLERYRVLGVRRLTASEDHG